MTTQLGKAQSALHERRARENREWATAYDAIQDALAGLLERAEGDGSSPQFTTTLRDELTRAQEEADRLENTARLHDLQAEQWSNR